MFGSGAGPLAANAAAGSSMAPALPPPVSPAPMASNPSNVISVIQAALRDPAKMAEHMANAGVTPDQFKQGITDHLSTSMQPTPGGTPPPRDLGQMLGNGNGNTPIQNPGSNRGEGSNNTPHLRDLMQPGDVSGGDMRMQNPSNDVFSPNGTRIVQPGPDHPDVTAANTDNFITPQTLLDFFLGESNGGNRGITGDYLGNNPNMVAGSNAPGVVQPPVPIAPPVVPPAPGNALAGTETNPYPVPVAPPTDVIAGSGASNPPMLGQSSRITGPSPASGRAGAFETHMPGDIRSYISEQAQANGLDPNYMMRMAVIESGGNPKAFNEGSKASGLYQFIPSTAKQYGLKDPFDWKANTDAAIKLSIDNKKYLTNALGREPQPWELYLAHQQGAAGAAELLTNPNKPAGEFVGDSAITSNGGKAGMSAGQFAKMWENKYNGTTLNSWGGGSKGDVMAGGSGNDSLGANGVPSGYGGNTTTNSPQGLNSRLADLAAALQDGGNGDGWSNMDMNLPKAPGAVPPRSGIPYDNTNAMKLMLMMLSPAGGQGLPSLTQLMGRA